MRNVTLVLEDGSKFHGKSFGYEKPVQGEVVFNSAMTGYPEALTDPVFAGQIMVMTYPQVGNYGVPSLDEKTDGLANFTESDRIQPACLIVSDYSETYCHWNAKESLGEWLVREQVPAITGIDTREITKTLRENGVMRGRIVFEGLAEETEAAPVYDEVNYAAQVCCKEVIRYNEGAPKKVVVVDCGIKNNTLRSLIRRGVEVIRVPWDYDFNTLEFDGLLLGSGPGNPDTCEATVANIIRFLQNDKMRPCLGIGMGNLLLAKAAGAKTYKLKYGHRTHNQPVRKVGTNTCFITTQTHGYAVDAATLPEEWTTSYVNMNDGTNEGIRHIHKPWAAVQFQPEACHNPVAADPIFDEFVTLL